MPNVLTTNSTVVCGHPAGGGGVVQVQSQAKLTVAGASVLVPDGIGAKSMSTLCGIPLPPAANKKCTKVISVSAGSATKLTVGGAPVVLQTLGGSTDGTLDGVTPQLLLAAVANQEKLRSA
jgi:hypothetical protein